MSKYHKRMVHKLDALYNGYCEEDQKNVGIRCVHNADVSSNGGKMHKKRTNRFERINKTYKKLVELCNIS